MPTPVVAFPTAVPSNGWSGSSVSAALRRDASDAFLSGLHMVHNALKDTDILAPCSRPPSPASQSRIDEMSVVIEDALRSGPQGLPHLLNLASTRLLGPHSDHPSVWGSTDHAKSLQSCILPLSDDESQWNLWVPEAEAPPSPMSAREAQKRLDVIGSPTHTHAHALDSTTLPRSKRRRAEQPVAGPSNHVDSRIMSKDVSAATTPHPRTASPFNASLDFSIGLPSQVVESPPDSDLYADGPSNFFSQSIITSTPIKGRLISFGPDVTPQAPPLRLGSWHQISNRGDKPEDSAIPMPFVSPEEHHEHMNALRSVPVMDLANLSAKKKIRATVSRNLSGSPTNKATRKVTLPHTPPDSNSQVSLKYLSQTSEQFLASGSVGLQRGLFEGPIFNSQYDVDSTVVGISGFISDDLA